MCLLFILCQSVWDPQKVTGCDFCVAFASQTTRKVKKRSNKGLWWQRDFSHVVTWWGLRSAIEDESTTCSCIFTNLYLLLLCLFNLIHLFLAFSFSFNSVCCCLEMASLLGAVEVLLICLLQSLINSRLVRFTDTRIEENMLHCTLRKSGVIDNKTDSTRLFDKKVPLHI